MKKLLFVVIGIVMIFSLVGCSYSYNNKMYIKPTSLTKETGKVLDLLNGELQLFDIEVDKQAKSYEISIWICRRGQWFEEGKTAGGIEKLGNQLAIRNTNTTYNFFLINEEGYSSYSYINKIDFDDLKETTKLVIETETVIELNKEVPILVKIGAEDSNIETLQITDNFRDLKCSTGIAVTLTILDQAIN